MARNQSHDEYIERLMRVQKAAELAEGDNPDAPPYDEIIKIGYDVYEDEFGCEVHVLKGHGIVRAIYRRAQKWYPDIISSPLTEEELARFREMQIRRIDRRKTAQRRVVLAPGVLLNELTQFLLTRDAHRRFVQPVIADMQSEYCDALAARHPWHAHWIAIRGHLLVLPGCVYGLFVHAVRRMFSV